MKKILIASFVMAALSSQASFAQVFDGDEDINVGIGRTEFLNSSLGATSLKIDYRSTDGLFVPVSIDLGSDLKSLSAGLGYKTGKQLSNIFTYSVAAAINHLRISEDIQTILKEDRNRFTLLLKQELTFQLTNRLALGINFDVDVLNQGRNHKAKMKTTPESYPLTRYRQNTNGT